MHTEVFNNIDTLIEMAGASLRNMDEVNAELITLKRQIRNKRNEIDDFRSILNDARYFNASNELVDKNIEISLKNKITRLRRKIKELDDIGKTLNSDEKTLHEEIKALRDKLTKNEKYIAVLEVKINDNKDNEYYNNMLNTENKNVKELRDILDNKTKEYNDLLKELELNNQALVELKEKLDSEEERLNDVLDNLSNPNAYIDEELKTRDEERLKTLESELENLEKREMELLTDASVIGADAKELLAINDANGALAKVKELVTIVKSKPYMDINNPTILDEELEKKESLRVELASLIDTKNYEGINSDAVKERIDYLNKEIESNNELVAKINNEISNIDEHISTVLGKKISDLETEIIKGEKVVQEYKELIKNKDNAPKTKTSLEQAVLKKQKEISILDNILAAYKETLVNKINDTNKLNNRSSNIQKENKRYLEELEDLKKVTIINFQSKDLVEEEKDKEDLRNLNEEIKQIKIRKQYDRNPNEIYDQIEMALASIKQPTVLREDKNVDILNDILENETENKNEEVIDLKIENNISNNDLNVKILDTIDNKEVQEKDNKIDLNDTVFNKKLEDLEEVRIPEVNNIDVNPKPQVEIVNEIKPEVQEINVITPDINLNVSNNISNDNNGEVIAQEKIQEPVIEKLEAGDPERIKVIDMIPVETVKKSGGNG